MEYKILVPDMGESIVDATIARWLKQAGQKVNAGEALVELETDKVTLEVPAEGSGTLAKIAHQEGDDVKVGDVLGVISSSQPESEPNPGSSQTARAASASDADAASRSEESTQVEPSFNANQTVTQAASEENATPLARRVAEGQGIDLARVQGSGPGGKVVREDVEKFVSQDAAGHKLMPAIPISRQEEDRREERVRASRRRRTIAQRMVAAQQSTAMLTTFNDVDMSAVMEIRQKRKEAFKEKHGFSLGIVSFFVKASILALKEFPQVNSELNGDDLVLKHYYDIGVAVGSEEGLVVPVIRAADHMTFSEIEAAIHNFVQKTRDGTLSLEDLKGGTFTITNGGVFGSLFSTPILNLPQVAILGLHRIEERPVVVDHQVVIRPMMYLAVTYDHRIVDGREAVQFLARIKEAIEQPEILLLEL